MKTKWHVGTIALILVLTLTLAGCQTIPEEHEGAAVGAGAGAATGAAAGALLGKSTEAAVIGGLVGALVGGAIGHYAYDQRRGRQETENAYNYKDDYGTVVSIENADVTPQTVTPGETVDIKLTYALLNPQGVTQIREIREITHEGRLVGKPEITVDRAAGTYTSTVPLHLPDSAARGLYEVTTIVETGNARDTRHTSFRVR